MFLSCAVLKVYLSVSFILDVPDAISVKLFMATLVAASFKIQTSMAHTNKTGE